MHPAVEQNVGYCLSSGSIIALGASYVWYFAVEEEVS